MRLLPKNEFVSSSQLPRNSTSPFSQSQLLPKDNFHLRHSFPDNRKAFSTYQQNFIEKICCFHSLATNKSLRTRTVQTATRWLPWITRTRMLLDTRVCIQSQPTPQLDCTSKGNADLILQTRHHVTSVRENAAHLLDLLAATIALVVLVDPLLQMAMLTGQYIHYTNAYT